MRGRPQPPGPSPGWSPTVLLHLPKTGGSSLRSAFDHQFGRAAVLRVDAADPSSTVASLQERSPAERRRTRAIVGHMPFGIHQVLGVPCTYVTMLRDPVARVLSLYAYLSRSDDPRLGWHMPADLSLEAFLLDWDMAPLVRNEQTRLLAGPFPGALTPVPDTALAEARRNLLEGIHVVGLTERFDESLLAVKALLGWRSPRYQRRKVAPRTGPRPDADPRLHALIQELNPLDMALYETAVERFERQLEACGGVTDQQLRRYRWVNAKSSRVRSGVRAARGARSKDRPGPEGRP